MTDFSAPSAGGSNGRSWMTISSLTIIVLIGYAGFTNSGMALKIERIDPLVASSTLLFFFVIALVVERSVEVLIALIFGSQEVEATLEAKAAERALNVASNAEREALKQLSSPEERLMYLERKLSSGLDEFARKSSEATYAAQLALGELSRSKTRAAGLLLVCMGGLLSVSGIQVLEPLILAAQGSVPGPGTQSQIFRATDVLISALLVGGGANGIHKLMKRVVDAQN